MCSTQVCWPVASSRPDAADERSATASSRGVDEDTGLVAVGGGGDGLRHVGGHVIRRRRAWREAGAGQAQRPLDPVQAEGPPVAAAGVPGQQIPAVRGVHQPVRLDVAGGDAAAALVAQPQLPLVPAGRRDRGQKFGVHGAGRGSGERERGGVKGRDLVPEPGRQHRLELGQRPERGLLQPGHAAGRRGMQADRHRDRLLVVQQQRRQGSAAGAEPVTARRAR